MTIILEKYNLDFSIAKLLQFVHITKLSLGLACLQVGELLLANTAARWIGLPRFQVGFEKQYKMGCSEKAIWTFRDGSTQKDLTHMIPSWGLKILIPISFM